MEESEEYPSRWQHENPRKPEDEQDHTLTDQESTQSRDDGSEFFDASKAPKPLTKRKSPLVIAVANQKGGVAKTTTVVSLGGALVNHEKEVLLVDLDSQANLTLALGKDPSRVRGSITDVLFHSATLLSVSRETNVPGLDLVPSNAGMDMAERFLPVRKDYEKILKRILADELRAGERSRESREEPSESSFERNFPVIEYDYVLLDCPPMMGAVTMNALIAADLLIVPTQAEFFSAHALRTMMGTIRQIRSLQNPKLVYRILITMLDRRNRIHREIREQLFNTFGEGVFQTVIEVDTKLRESAVQGKPIMHHRAHSRSALQYEALAQEIFDYPAINHPTEKAPYQGNF
jgi:chromosome partitioning protein